METIKNELTEKEINESLKLFKQAIKEKKITYTHADPTQQYCYISSNDVYGVYFPNSEIKLNRDVIEFVAIVKNSNELGIAYEYNEQFKGYTATLCGYFFMSFDEILYTKNERNLYEVIDKEIKDCKKNIEILSSVKLLYKKDGGEFANILKAFDPTPAQGVHISATFAGWHNEYLELHQSKEHKTIDGDTFRTYSSYTLYNCGDLSYYDIKEAIARDLENKRKHVAELEQQRKQVKTLCKKVEKFGEYLSAFKYCIKDEAQKILQYESIKRS